MEANAETNRNMEDIAILNDSLCDILRELAVDDGQNALKDIGNRHAILNKFENIYCDDANLKFRHSYSQIYSTLTELQEEGLSIDVVQQNIELIYIESLKGDNIKLKEGLYKLKDHINLDIGRIQFLKSSMEKINSRIGEVNDAIKGIDGELKKINDNARSLDENVTETKKELDNIKEDAADLNTAISKKITDIKKAVKQANTTKKKIDKAVTNLYSQMASVIGVFAAIVIVFFGGSSLFSGIFSEVVANEINWWDAGAIISLIGLVVFDIVFMFLYVLAKLLEKDIFTGKYEDKFFLKRWIKKYPYVFIFNILMLLIFFICA